MSQGAGLTCKRASRTKRSAKDSFEDRSREPLGFALAKMDAGNGEALVVEKVIVAEKNRHVTYRGSHQVRYSSRRRDSAETADRRNASHEVRSVRWTMKASWSEMYHN